jgi:hypothetical protein
MIDRVLLLSLGGCAVFGTLLFLELTPADNAPAHDDQQAVSGVTPPAKAPPAAQVQRPQLDELVATLLSRPLFSPTRKPPEQEQATADRPADRELPKNLRLTAIIIDPDRSLAIFAVAGAKPLVRKEGEMVEQWRLISIGPRQVLLSGIEKPLEPTFDPNLVRPVSSAPPGATPGQPGRPGRPPFPAGSQPPAPPLRPAPAPPGPVTPTQQR